MELEFFSGVRKPALNDYASLWPSCLLESIERLHQSSFIFYTGRQSHYTQRKLGPKAPEWLRKSQDPLVYQTGHGDDRNSLKCIIGKVQLIKDGNNFCLSYLEEQRLVALLQGSIESDDSPASSGDEEEGEQARADNFSEPIRFEAGRSRSGRPTTRHVL